MHVFDRWALVTIMDNQTTINLSLSHIYIFTDVTEKWNKECRYATKISEMTRVTLMPCCQMNQFIAFHYAQMAVLLPRFS